MERLDWCEMLQEKRVVIVALSEGVTVTGLVGVAVADAVTKGEVVLAMLDVLVLLEDAAAV